MDTDQDTLIEQLFIILSTAVTYIIPLKYNADNNSPERTQKALPLAILCICIASV